MDNILYPVSGGMYYMSKHRNTQLQLSYNSKQCCKVPSY